MSIETPQRERDIPLVALVTPVWRPSPTDDERWNIRTTRDAMPAVDHVFVGPVGLDPSPWLRLSAGSRFRAAAPRHFAGIWEYSRMMLDARFYKPFGGYRFMVLVQTDAFLVRDLAPRLTHATFDYAGAPWHRPYPMTSATVYSRRLGEMLRPLLSWQQCVVGNGGLSIRRVQAFVDLLRERPLLHRYARVNEDIVLSHLGLSGDLSLASESEAASLFFETAGSDSVPTGVYGYHALQRFHPDRYAELRRSGVSTLRSPSGDG